MRKIFALLTFTLCINGWAQCFVTIPDTFICSGTTATLTAHASGGNGQYTYLWNTGSSLPSIIISPSVTTTYTVTVTSGSCIVTSTGTVHVSKPMVTFSLVADISPHTWDAYPNYSGGYTPFTYSWNWGDGTSPSTTAYPSHTYATAGTYSICVTLVDAFGCSASYCQNDFINRLSNNSTLSSMVYVNVLNNQLGINQNFNTVTQISVFPNPIVDQFVIETNSSHKINVDIYDFNGRLVFSKNVNDKENINVTTLDNGAYTLVIKTADITTNKKLIILR